MRSPKFMTLGGALVVLGIIFGVTARLIGYSFIGAEVLLSIISTVISKRKAKKANRAGDV